MYAFYTLDHIILANCIAKLILGMDPPILLKLLADVSYLHINYFSIISKHL